MVRAGFKLQVLRAVPVIILALACLGTVGAPLGIWSSHVERMSHFRLWWIGLLVILGLVYARTKRKALAGVAITAVAWAAWPLLPYWHAPGEDNPDASPTPTFKIIAWNLLWENPRKPEGLRWLSAQNADLLLLTECTLDWMKVLAPLKSKYPHQISSGRDGAEGMWLLSRHPLDPPDPAGLAQNKPWISTVVHASGGRLRFIGMHPRTPRSGARFEERNIQYDRAAAISANSEIPVIVAGDLNCTPFSPWFSRLLTHGKLRDTAEGHGLGGTWSGQGIHLPIDHILASPGWSVIGREIHPDRMGSDHNPVIAILASRSGSR